MLYTYTAVISESDGTFYAKVPDVNGCITTASSLSEAISLIADALNLCLVGLEDEGIKPSPATPQSEIQHSPGDILTIIQADTIKYLSATNNHAVRKNVPLPAWMVSLADKRDINCIYPAVFYPESGGRFSVIFPDLNGLATCGDSLADAFSMAQDACGQYLFTSLRDGEALPSPTPLNSVEKDDPSAIVNLVYVNLGEYACAYTPSRFGIPIPYKPQHKAQNDPQNNIHNRMLFNEHGGQNDQH